MDERVDPEAPEPWGRALARLDRAAAEVELDAFLERARAWPAARRAAWVDDWCAAAFDLERPLPLPARLARTLVLPELARGVRDGRGGAARWMAQVPHALEPHREAAGLPRGAGLRETLLERALRLDPRDDRARRLLLAHLRSELEWACDGDAPRADPSWVAARALRVAELTRELGDPDDGDVPHWLATAARWASGRRSV